MKKKGFVIGGLIILAGAAGAGGWYYYKENYGDSAAASGEVAYVTKISTLLGEDSGVLNRFAGVVEPQETVKVNIENNRTVTEVKVKVGDEVKKGQLLLDVISPVGKTARTGHFLAVNHLRGAYIGNLRQTRQDALTIDIAKPSLYIVFLIKRHIQAGMLLANLRQVLYFRCYFHLKSCHSNKLLSF